MQKSYNTVGNKMNKTGIAFAPPPVLSPIPTEYEEPENVLTKSFANQSEKSNAL